MKKILIIFAIAVLSIANASAINLQEAFSALSNLPNVTVKENLDLKVERPEHAGTAWES